MNTAAGTVDLPSLVPALLRVCVHNARLPPSNGVFGRWFLPRISMTVAISTGDRTQHFFRQHHRRRHRHRHRRHLEAAARHAAIAATASTNLQLEQVKSGLCTTGYIRRREVMTIKPSVMRYICIHTHTHTHTHMRSLTFTAK